MVNEPSLPRFLLGAVLVSCGWLVARAQDPVPARSPGPTVSSPAAEAGVDDEPIVSLAAYNVGADRIEDFGIRIESAPYPDAARLLTSGSFWFAKFAPLIATVVPNTAASKAGLQPGERILKSDGRATVGGLFSTGRFGQWSKAQKKKWAEVAAGKTNVTWALEVESPQTKAVRTVKLVVPMAAPHWGASLWRPPPERPPSAVPENGPLAERSRLVLDNGIATLLRWPFTSIASDNGSPRAIGFLPAYEWRLENDHRLHRIIVTQLRGRTWIFFETLSPTTGQRIYLTSPSGVLEKAWRWGRQEVIALMKANSAEAAAKIGEVSRDEASRGFEHELDLWTTKVGKFSPRWPMEVVPGYDPDAIFAVLAPVARESARAAPPPLPAEFLGLPAATDAHRALFADAYAKLGADQDSWAYTETSHAIDDRRVRVTRVDPSKSEAERSVLLSIDGKPPTAIQVQEWRDDGGDVPKALGDFPPLESLVDLKDLRIAEEGPDAVVFELPIRGGNADFPAGKFQARFRVSRTARAFEDISVNLRDSFRVAGVVKVTEAGLHARFQTVDPAAPPQPVLLQGGGSARIVLIKVSRDFETTRTDFQRVQPHEEPAKAGPGP